MANFLVATCTDPIWGDPEHTFINCKVIFVGMPVTHSFNAMGADPETHGRALFAELIAGEYGPIAEHTAQQAPSKPILRSTGTNKV